MSLFEWRVGDHVRISGKPYGGRQGVLVEQHRRLGQELWTVQLTDSGDRPRHYVENEVNLAPPPPVSDDWLKAGTKVIVLHRALRGITGELVRPSRFFWIRAWRVRYENARTWHQGDVREQYLYPLSRVVDGRPLDVDGSISAPGPQRSSRARPLRATDAKDD